MGFNFNPSLWFVCRLCGRSFVSTDTLREHKLACHLGECLQIKSIVFEERLLNEEWIPERHLRENQNQVLKAKPENWSSLKDYRNRNETTLDYGSETQPLYKNPYVSLKRVREQEINGFLLKQSSSHKRQKQQPRTWKPLGRRSSSKSKPTDEQGSELSHRPQELYRDGGVMTNSEINRIDLSASQNSSSNDDIQPTFEILLKKEPLLWEVSAPQNESAYTTFEDKNGPEIFVASDSLTSDGFSHSQQFAATFIPTSAQEYQLLQQQYLNLDATITESQQQQLMPNNKPTDCDLNLSAVEIKLETYDFNLLENSPEVETQEQKQKPEVGGSIQQQQQQLQSAPLLNCQSKTASGATIAKPFMCEICFACFRKNCLLKAHMACHSSTKPFVCSECPSKFKRKRELDRHQIVHGKETKFKCRVCSKSFGGNSCLQEHERIHTGHRPFKCPVANCDYESFRAGRLKDHTRALHSEELGLQQFVCPKCGKTYGIKKRLEIHIRTRHSEIAAFHCAHPGCISKFKSMQQLQAHWKMHT